MPKLRIRTRLYRESEKARADGRSAWADLMLEAADQIKDLEGSPERRRDIRFQRHAIRFLSKPRELLPIYVKAWRTIVFAPPKAAASIKTKLAALKS